MKLVRAHPGAALQLGGQLRLGGLQRSKCFGPLCKFGLDQGDPARTDRSPRNPLAGQGHQVRLVGELTEQAAVVSQRLVRLTLPALALREAEESGCHQRAQVIARAYCFGVGRGGGREVTLGFLGKKAALQRVVERVGPGGEGGQPEEHEQGTENFHGEDRHVTAW